MIESAGKDAKVGVISACLLMLWLTAPLRISAQELEFPAAAAENDEALAKAMPGLARQAIAVYVEPDRPRYLGAIAT